MTAFPVSNCFASNWSEVTAVGPIEMVRRNTAKVVWGSIVLRCEIYLIEFDTFTLGLNMELVLGLILRNE